MNLQMARSTVADEEDCFAQSFRGMSCPQEPIDEELIEYIALESSRAILQSFLTELKPSVDSSSIGLTTLLSEWVERATPSAAAWHFSFGNLAYITKLPKRANEAVKYAASSALHLMSHGAVGAWRADFSEPQPVLWGEYVLPSADEISVQSDGKNAILEIQADSTAHVLEFSRSPSGWKGPLTRLPQFGSSERPITILPPSAVNPAEFRDVFASMATATPTMVATCEAAIDITASVAPQYVGWITRLMRHIVLLTERDSIIQSATSVRHPGFSYLSFSTNPLSIAEMLVHEVSHQHFNLLARLGPLVDPSHQKQYYSPLKATGRPLDRILLAYHAFGNVLLFYRACLQHGRLDQSHCVRTVSEIEGQLRTMDASLRDNPALTALGRVMFEPLAGRLWQVG
jgi:hypothetical protein